MKKILKSLLRILCVILVIVLIRAGLTKFGLISNRFDFDILSPESKINWQKYLETYRNIKYRNTKNVDVSINYDGDDAELYQAIKSMKLVDTGCPNIYCQSVADDGTNKNKKHYYRNNEDNNMILIPNLYFVSSFNCAEGYDKLYEENIFADLFQIKKSMGLKSTGCPNIFFQPVEDDESMAKYHWKEDHDYYYWDKENKKMILMPNISYVGSSDCESYDKWFVEDGFKTEMNDLGVQIVERQTCSEYSPHRNICSSKVKCKKVLDMSDITEYKCCNQEGECIFIKSYAVRIPDCNKGPC